MMYAMTATTGLSASRCQLRSKPLASRTRTPVKICASKIPGVTDPEETRKEAIRKERETVWGTPGPNKNPLERHTLSREGVTKQSKDLKDQQSVQGFQEGAQAAAGGIAEGAKDIAENVQNAVSNVAEKAKDAAKKVTGKGE